MDVFVGLNEGKVTCLLVGVRVNPPMVGLSFYSVNCCPARARAGVIRMAWLFPAVWNASAPILTVRFLFSCRYKCGFSGIDIKPLGFILSIFFKLNP